MICIAYLSTAALSPAAGELEGILAASRRNNVARGITGLLCHYDGSFLQFLEGEEDQVEATYAVIGDDPRHHSLLRLYRKRVPERLFADWSMAVAKPDAIGAEHRQFCQGLRQLQLDPSDAYAREITPFLDAFRAWLR